MSLSIVPSVRCTCAVAVWLCLHIMSGSIEAGHFTSGNETAVKFGVHEVVLTGWEDVANPFDTIATVTFLPPSGDKQAKTVHAFYDGDNTWRARVYVSEAGAWKWSAHSETDQRLDAKEGFFTAGDSQLRGRLLVHSRNPRQWMTEDGRWFLNLNDTAYFLLCTHDAGGEPIPSEDFSAYVRDDVAQGITSMRCFLASASKGFLAADNTDRHRWYDIFANESLTHFRLETLQNTDRRLQWLLNEHPDVYVQLILFPLGSRYGADDSFWKAMSPVQREHVMRHLLAR